MDLTVLISAPSDQERELSVAKRAIEDLHNLLEPHGHSIRSKDWKSNLSTGKGSRAQDVINDQSKDCDAIVAIIGPRLGTPTGGYESGTVEEIQTFIDRCNSTDVSYTIHVLLNAKTLANPFDIDTEQLAKVQSFRASLNEKGIHFAQFSSDETLRNLVQVGVSNLVGKAKPFVEIRSEEDPLYEFDELGFLDAIEIADEKMGNATEAIKNISHGLSVMSDKLDGLNAEMKNHQGGIDGVKLLSEKLSKILIDARKELYPSVAIMRENLDQSYAHLNLSVNISIEDAQRSDSEPQLEVLSSNIMEAIDSAEKALTAFTYARKQLHSVPRATREIRKSKKGLLVVFDEILEILESFIRDGNSLLNLMKE